MLRQASVDIKANPLLVEACPQSIAFCQQNLMQEADKDDGGKIEECLKEEFRKKHIIKHGDTAKCLREVAKVVETASISIEVRVTSIRGPIKA